MLIHFTFSENTSLQQRLNISNGDSYITLAAVQFLKDMRLEETAKKMSQRFKVLLAIVSAFHSSFEAQ